MTAKLSSKKEDRLYHQAKNLGYHVRDMNDATVLVDEDNNVLASGLADIDGFLRNEEFLNFMACAKFEFKTLWENQVVNKRVLTRALDMAHSVIEVVKEYQRQTSKKASKKRETT